MAVIEANPGAVGGAAAAQPIVRAARETALAVSATSAVLA